MARSKTISDEALLDRLVAEITAVGPADMTFARAAKAAGLSPATLVQRFRTRDAMVEAVLLHAWDRLDAITAAADAEASLDAAGAVALLLRLTPAMSPEDGIADGLLLLREDIRNPILRARGAAWGVRLADAVDRRLTAAPHRGQRLGWQMASVWQGALIWWAFTRDGDPEDRVRAALEDWLESAAPR